MMSEVRDDKRGALTDQINRVVDVADFRTGGTFRGFAVEGPGDRGAFEEEGGGPEETE